MPTFGEMQTKIEGYLKRSGMTADIQTAIQRACKFYDRDDWFFNEADASFVTVNGTKNYSFNSLMTSALSVMLNYNGARIKLEPATLQRMDEIDVQAWKGQPSEYAVWNGAFRLYPTPDGSYTVSYAYSTKYVTLSASTDTNGLLSNAEDMIEQWALSWLYHNVINSQDYAARHRQAADMFFASLRRESVLKSSTGRLKPTAF